MRKLLFLSAMLTLSPLVAQGCCESRFCVEGEYLLLKPSIHDPYYVVPEGGSNEPFGTRFGNFWSFHSGVRLRGTYRNLCDCGISALVEGFWLGDSHSECIDFRPNFGVGTKGNVLEDTNSVEVVKTRIKYDLYNVKGGFSTCLLERCRLSLQGQLLLHFANLIVDERIFYDELANVTFVTQRDKAWAVGPEAAIGLNYELLCDIAFTGRVAFGLLAGENHASARTLCIPETNPNSDDVVAHNQGNSVVVPFSEFKLGFAWARACGCFKPHVEVGYNFLRYTDFYDSIRWCGDRNDTGGTIVGAEGLSFDHYGPFMAHGLYVTLGVCF